MIDYEWKQVFNDFSVQGVRKLWRRESKEAGNRMCIDSSSIHTYLSLLAQMSLSLNSRPQCHQTLCEELWTILDSQVNQAADKLKSVIAPFVESSKTMAINISDQVTLVLSDLFASTFHLITYTSTSRATKRAGDPPQGLCLKWWRRSPNYSPTSTCKK